MLGFGSAHLVLFQRASPQLLVVSTVLKSSLFYPASEAVHYFSKIHNIIVVPRLKWKPCLSSRMVSHILIIPSHFICKKPKCLFEVNTLRSILFCFCSYRIIVTFFATVVLKSFI